MHHRMPPSKTGWPSLNVVIFPPVLRLVLDHPGDYTGQQNVTVFFGPRTSMGELSNIFMLNSDMYTEFFYQAEFKRYGGLYLCKMVLYVPMKQAETYL